MRRLLLVMVLVGGAAACNRTKAAQQGDSATVALPPGHVPIDEPAAGALQPATQVLLDSGNVAFRKKDFDAALRYYRQAAELQPDHAAPWFGTYMVGQATKNTVLADSALKMVRARAPEMQAHPGAVPPGKEAPSLTSPHRQVPRAPGAPS